VNEGTHPTPLAMSKKFDYITEHSLESLKEDYKTVDAIIRKFEIIGEVSKNIPG